MMKMNTSNENTVTVKVAFGEELRRFSVQDPSFAKLVAQVQELFKIDGAAELCIKYKDDESDKITMSSDLELKEALAISAGGILRLEIAVKQPQAAPSRMPAPLVVEDKTLAKEQKKRIWQEKKALKCEMKAEHVKMKQAQRLIMWQTKQAKARAAGKLVARHVKDVTIADGTELPPNTNFVKTWRIRNEGAQWPAGCSLLFVGHNSDRMNGPESVPLPGAVDPEQEIDVSVPLTSPAEPGRYVGYWRLCAPDGRKFGQRLWVSIAVPSTSSSSDEGANVNRAPDSAYEDLATKVEGMGFPVKRKRIMRMLMKHGGDVDKVVGALAENLNKRMKM